jgi:hypothetical protein
LVVAKNAARRNRATNPRDHVDGCVPGGRFENVVALLQGQLVIMPRRL